MSSTPRDLTATEELDFAYLLELMTPLHDEPEYAWLPELFSIIGHKRLITLCKYAGGETITIPTLYELDHSVASLQWFYDIVVTGKHSIEELPKVYAPTVKRIIEIYNADDHKR